MDRTYAQFGVKHVDWDALYRVYRPQVTPATTDEELWDILLTMLRHLNDSHVCLADGTRRICGGLTGGLRARRLLPGPGEDEVPAGQGHGRPGRQLHLRLADRRDRVPAHRRLQGRHRTDHAGDRRFMREFAKARAIVVDVRGNPGGTGRAAELVANRFADRRRHYMRVQTRYGPGTTTSCPWSTATSSPTARSSSRARRSC